MTREAQSRILLREKVNAALADVMATHQLFGAVFGFLLTLLVASLLIDDDNITRIALWCAFSTAAMIFKILVYSQKIAPAKQAADSHFKMKLLLLSAALTGITWCVPVNFIDHRNRYHLLTTALVVSGIISGAISAYLGDKKCIVLIATPGCISLVVVPSLQGVDLPFQFITSICAFYAFVLAASARMNVNMKKQYTAQFEKRALISKLAKSRKEQYTVANTDELTGLPNRRQVFRLFTKLAVAAQKAKQKLGVIYLDINGFKGINDTYGHEAGDTVLKEVSRVLKAAVQPGDVAARLSGDEFVVLLSDVGGVEGALEILRRLHRDLAVPLTLSATTIILSASLGLSIFPDQGTSFEQLLKIADSEMYDRKKSYYAENPHDRRRR